jgi:phage FluMu protein Com
MDTLRIIRKYKNLRCEFCGDNFLCRQAKFKHIKMNRCPEIKKLIEAGQMQPYPKKQKVQESVIVREPEITSVQEKKYIVND